MHACFSPYWSFRTQIWQILAALWIALLCFLNLAALTSASIYLWLHHIKVLKPTEADSNGQAISDCNLICVSYSQNQLLCTADNIDTTEGVELPQVKYPHFHYDFQPIFARIASNSVVWCYLNSSGISENLFLILIRNLKPIVINSRTSLDFSRRIVSDMNS